METAVRLVSKKSLINAVSQEAGSRYSSGVYQGICAGKDTDCSSVTFLQVTVALSAPERVGRLSVFFFVFIKKLFSLNSKLGTKSKHQ